MAVQWERVNLNSQIFPFTTQLWGRSIVVPQFDQNYSSTAQTAEEKDKGIPQIYYAENVMPTAGGLQSVGYDIFVDPIVPPADDFDQAFAIQNESLANFIFSPAAGKNYIYDRNVGHWVSISPFPSGTVPQDVMVTVAFVQGQSYIFYERYGCFVYNEITKQMDPVTLTGLDPLNIIGICAANGYLIAWDEITVAWSGIGFPTDFTPSLVTGAGGGSVADAKGAIKVCLPISGGFIVYCAENSVSARFSGNARFPYIFQELPGSGGLSSAEYASSQSNLGDHFSWTTNGLQQLDKSSCKLIFQECSDFLATLSFETYDRVTKTFSLQYLSSPVSIKINAISARYITISVGTTYPDFTYALIYDLAFKRWGKAFIEHRDIFQWHSPSFYGELTYGDLQFPYSFLAPFTTYDDLRTQISSSEVPKKSIAFLQKDGTVKVMNFDLASINNDAVLVLGKYQFKRNNFIVHQLSDFEVVNQGNNFEVHILPTIDGKTFLPAVPARLLKESANTRRYGKRVSGLNYSELILGAFNLNSLVMSFTDGGDIL